MFKAASEAQQRQTRTGLASVGVTARAEIYPAPGDPWAEAEPEMFSAFYRLAVESMIPAEAARLRAAATVIFQRWQASWAHSPLVQAYDKLAAEYRVNQVRIEELKGELIGKTIAYRERVDLLAERDRLIRSNLAMADRLHNLKLSLGAKQTNGRKRKKWLRLQTDRHLLGKR